MYSALSVPFSPRCGRAGEMDPRPRGNHPATHPTAPGQYCVCVCVCVFPPCSRCLNFDPKARATDDSEIASLHHSTGWNPTPLVLSGHRGPCLGSGSYALCKLKVKVTIFLMGICLGYREISAPVQHTVQQTGCVQTMQTQGS